MKGAISPTYGPSGCNMCGGVISESLVQALSVEGIELPPDVVQRGIDSLYFHSDRETVALDAPFRQMRIAHGVPWRRAKGCQRTEMAQFRWVSPGIWQWPRAPGWSRIA